MLRSASNLLSRSQLLQMTYPKQPRKTYTSPPAPPSQDPPATPMLKHQATLPHLPVPSLPNTLSKYLSTIHAHHPPSSSPALATHEHVQAFLRSPLAQTLQARLEARAADPSVTNWLAEWWNESAYMGYRDPVVVYVSYFYVHRDVGRARVPDGGTRPGVGRGTAKAAMLVKAMLGFREMTESQTLEPEMIKGVPLCMDSYKWLFHASRYPQKPIDTAKKFDAKIHNHIVFVRKNKFYEVPLVSRSGKELSVAELEIQIERVKKLAGDEEGVPVGALTSDNRDNWADAREALLAASPTNAHTLERIESSVIVVCLDDTKPVTREELSWACWVGDGRNRFYDKHQLLVFENGRSGFLGEHSCMDGTPTLRMNEYVLAAVEHGKVDLGPDATGSELPFPKELGFVLDKRCVGYAKDACARFDALVGKHDLEVLHYEGYGKDLMKKYRASPDAWVQMVKQLAFHKMYGRPGVTYESCQTRKYALGRTEVIRSASVESRAWAEAMLDEDVSDTRRADLFRLAIARHLEYARWAADGQGVDRHLFGLKKMLREDEAVPGIFTDPVYARTSHWELSTSQLSSRYLDGWGYGEVVPDGYGLSYSIGERYIRWTMTSLKRDTKVLGHFLAEAATETREMMERAAAAVVGGPAKL
ncbi:acyltransferase ChoActase/COT/CPT [Phlebopus sp. FC_14]|nr:acyltransferase ChoActase/COT/CPT [Phlebopus sp. FC_14]